MTYRLYRMASFGDELADGELIGVFGDFDEALDARDDDAVTLLTAVGGAAMLACHRIVGPGMDGPDTAHAVTSSLGVDGDEPVDVEAVATDTRAWLRHIRRGETPS